MRTPLEIVAELKNVTHWSQPNIKFNETMALLNELEATLTPTEPVKNPVVETVVVETPTETVETTTVESKTTRKATKK
jgi:hypothetical protein